MEFQKISRRADLSLKSPYNTYVHYGLPPSPIANPGRKSLEAVEDPLKTKDLYFVSRNDGTHAFSKTKEEHDANVYRYQILPFRKPPSAGN